MKHTITTLFALILCGNIASAQQIPSNDNVISSFNQLRQLNEQFNKKGQLNSKAAQFDHILYELEYDTAQSHWDTIQRTINFTDAVAGSTSKGKLLGKIEELKANGWSNKDSLTFVIDTSYNQYKIPQIAFFDSAVFYSWDSTNAQWDSVFQYITTANTNKDVVSFEVFLHLGFLGIPGGTFAPFSRTDFFYNGNNHLTGWITKGFSFGSPLVNEDSAVVTTNANGYRTSDHIYSWDAGSSTWEEDKKEFYFYDANDNLIEEYSQFYDLSNLVYVNSQRHTYNYDAQNREIKDSVFQYVSGAWDALRCFNKSYTIFNDRDSIVEIQLSGTIPFVASTEIYYYNASNLRDSVVKRVRLGNNISHSLDYTEKDWYTRQPLTGGSSAPVAPSNLIVIAGQKTTIPTMALSWSDNASTENGFGIQRSVDSLVWNIIDSTLSNVSSYLDTSLSSGVRYYYRVNAYNQNGNSAYSNIASKTSLLVSLNENLNSKLNIYPNPAKNQITIYNLSIGHEIRMFDINGRVVGTWISKSQLILEIDHLKAGIYFLNDGKSSFKLIKQ